MSKFKIIPDDVMTAIAASNFPIKTIERVIAKTKDEIVLCFAYRGLLVNWDKLDTTQERADVHAHIKSCDSCKAWAKKHKVDWQAITKDEDVPLP